MKICIRWVVAALAVALPAALALAAPDLSAPQLQAYVNGDKYSGYVLADPTTRKMQDDEFENPGMMWVDQGRELWYRVEGKAGKSCASCHGDPESMRGVATRYPAVDKETGQLMSIEHRINQSRIKHMEAEPWKWESDEMLGTSALVRSQSRGMPIQVKVDGEAKPFFEQGKAFYNQRRGQLDMACANCHIQNRDGMIRSERLSMGMPNGFPTYRLKWQKLGSLHRRFRGCNSQVRAEPYKQGSPEYTALELFVMWRASDLPVETPSVRK